MFRVCSIALSSLFLLSACASGTFKARQEQREKLATSAGLYCEFVNGDQHPDVDVELNMQMARRCDASRNFSIINYKNASDQIGVVYCCAMPDKNGGRVAANRREPRQVAPAPIAAKPAPATATPAAPAETSTEEVLPE
ncbi:hypothetical protein [Bdellovibrio sp. NC01]|uniref:hypothetical protein n=1 Tax=Bdellovibrio sp. NC01 TaxID=2220073 RepID=UPI001AEF6C6F|nr:hypothetical protein [Bdellovibrio sp. NC01]